MNNKDNLAVVDLQAKAMKTLKPVYHISLKKIKIVIFRTNNINRLFPIWPSFKERKYYK